MTTCTQGGKELKLESNRIHEQKPHRYLVLPGACRGIGLVRKQRFMADDQYVLFRLGSERFGLPVAAVEEVLPLQHLVPVAKGPKEVLGAFNLRGTNVPVFCARARFGMPRLNVAKNVLVVRVDEGLFGMQVDCTDGVLPLDDGLIHLAAAIPFLRADEAIRAVAKTEDRLTMLLDPHRIAGARVSALLMKKAA